MEDELTPQQNELLKRVKENYINSYLTLVSENIKAIYDVLGNNHNYTLTIVKNISLDEFVLNKNDQLNIDKNIKIYLKEKYNLRLTTSCLSLGKDNMLLNNCSNSGF